MARKSRKNLPVEVEPIQEQLSTALYIRLSVEDSKGFNCSIENQQLILNDYISERPEFSVYDVYIDNGLSGLSFDRPSFKRMLSDIENGKINCVISKDLSRLGRNAIDTGYYIEQYFARHKIRYIAVNDGFDTADQSSQYNSILLPLKNMVNEAYALDIGKKKKAQVHQSMLNGEFVGSRAPFGYLKDPKDHHKLIIDEDAAQIVQQIFEWFTNGIGLNAIAVKLNDMGVMPSSLHKSTTTEAGANYRKSNYWHSRTVRHILTNETYTGDMVQGKSKAVDHKQKRADESEYIIVHCTHAPIVSREQFEKARQILSDNRQKVQSQEVVPYSPNIFSCEMVCAHCGKPLYRQRCVNNCGKIYYYFSCPTVYRITKNACPGTRINEDIVQRSVFDAISEEVALSDDYSIESYKKADKSLKNEKKLKQCELNDVMGFIRSLYENLVEGIITADEYAELKTGYENKASALREDISRVNDEMGKLSEQYKQNNSLINDAALFKREMTLTPEIISRLIKKISISHEQEIFITFNSGRERRVYSK